MSRLEPIRPVLHQILSQRSMTTIVDSTRAEALGVEIAGCLSLLIQKNRAHVWHTLELIESCASSPERHLRIERVVDSRASAIGWNVAVEQEESVDD